MTSHQEQEINSFVLRFVRESNTYTVRWRGRIRHVQSDQEISFAHLTQALHFIHDKLQAKTSPPPLSSTDINSLWYNLDIGSDQ